MTVFSDQLRADEIPPNELREQIEGLALTHVATGSTDGSSAGHPLLRLDSDTERVAQFDDAPEQCAAIDGLGRAESCQRLSALLALAIAPANHYRHHWHLGDVVMGDTGVIMQWAEYESADEDPVLHRGVVAGIGAMA